MVGTWFLLKETLARHLDGRNTKNWPIDATPETEPSRDFDYSGGMCATAALKVCRKVRSERCPPFRTRLHSKEHKVGFAPFFASRVLGGSIRTLPFDLSRLTSRTGHHPAMGPQTMPHIVETLKGAARHISTGMGSRPGAVAATRYNAILICHNRHFCLGGSSAG